MLSKGGTKMTDKDAAARAVTKRDCSDAGGKHKKDGDKAANGKTTTARDSDDEIVDVGETRIVRESRVPFKLPI